MNPINTAMLSYGMSGEVFHAPLLYAHKGFTLSTILQRNSTKAKEHFAEVNVVKSMDEIFNDPSIELIIINTPNETHFEFTMQALNADKHVVVEKPFTVTTDEANKLITAAKQKNKMLTVFQNRRWDGDFITVRKVIENNLVGKIVEFEAHYDRFRNYIEPGTWKEESKPGTGILYNLGSHMLDQVIVLFGMPEYVDARLGIQRPHGEVDDYYDIRLRYTNELNVIVKSSYLVREQGPRYSIHGVEGSFVKYGLDPQEQDLKDKKIPGGAGWGAENRQWWGKLNTTINGLNYEGFIATVPGDYLSFYQNVYEVIREGKELKVKPEQSRQVIQLIEACFESNRIKSAVKV